MNNKIRSIMIVLSLYALVFVPFYHHAQAATCAWIGGSGNWNDPAHWSCGFVPGSVDDAIINENTAVTLTENATVGSLTLSFGGLTGAFNLTADTINWDGGTISGSGSTTANTTVNLTGTNDILLYRTFNNVGSLVWNRTGLLGLMEMANSTTRLGQASRYSLLGIISFTGMEN